MWLTTEGLRPGCDEERDRPGITEAPEAGNEERSFEAPDEVDEGLLRSGDEGSFMPEGPFGLKRRLDIEPFIVDGSINGAWSNLAGTDTSERTEKVEPPRGR